MRAEGVCALWGILTLSCPISVTPMQGYLAVRGTGYRKERKGNPLPNIFRQWCDAKEVPCIVIEQVTG